MEPLKPQDKEAILADNPEADPGDVDEYERLLAEMFVDDPDQPQAAPEGLLAQQSRSVRLEQLYRKLFPNR